MKCFQLKYQNKIQKDIKEKRKVKHGKIEIDLKSS